MKIQEISNTQKVDEGLGRYLKYIGAKVGSLFSDRLKGKANMLKAANKVLSLFNQSMGSRNEKFKNVTWGSLIRFLSNPSLLGLSRSQVVKIINNPKIKKQVENDWQKLSSGMVPSEESWGQPDEPIGGPGEDMMAGKLAEIAVTYIIELAVVEYLENRTQGTARTQQSPDTTYDDTYTAGQKRSKDDDEDYYTSKRKRYMANPPEEPESTKGETEPADKDSAKAQPTKSPWNVKTLPTGKSRIPSSPEFDIKPIQVKIGTLSKDKLQRIRKIITDKLGAAS